MTSLAHRRTAPGARTTAPAAADPGRSAPSPTFATAKRQPAGFPRLTPVAAAAAPSPAMELPEFSTSHEPAPGGGLLKEHAGNTKPSERTSKNVAGPAQNAEVRHGMKMGSSTG